MGLISKQATVKISSHNFKHYEDLGYTIPRYKNIKNDMVFKRGTTIMVNVSDLTNGSKSKVKVKCDNCGKEKELPYIQYLKYVKNKDIYYCNQCANEIQGKTFYTTESYKLKLIEMGNNIKLKDNAEFINTHTKIIHICPICKKEWKVIPMDILKGHLMCDKCANSVKESIMANTLKQVFKHYYLKTEWEYDLGFKTKTNSISKYDMFVPEINTIFEFQSKYHDDFKQKSIDNDKKEYAISKGYKFISLDSRDYTPLQAIQLFFPKIKSIPKYVILNKNTITNYSIEEIQKLLNQNLNYKEISNKLNIDHIKIKEIVFQNNLIRPNNYHKSSAKPIICLNTLEYFTCASEIHKKYLIDESTIHKCCKGKRKSAGKLSDDTPLKWMYYDEWLQLHNEKVAS